MPILSVDDQFYLRYGEEWSKPLRSAHEEVCSLEKVENWKTLISGDLQFKKFIDFGCGNGVFLHHFADVSGSSGIGIDVSPSMLAAARARFPAHQFLQGDVSALGQFKGQTDVVFFNDVIEHLTDPQRYLTAAAGVGRYVGVRVPLEKTWMIAALNTLKLKRPVSRLYASDGHLYEWSMGDVHRLFRASGLEVVREFVTNDSARIVFHPHIRENMKGKAGLSGKIRFLVYRIMELMPYPVTRAVLRPLKGSTLVALCRARSVA